MEISAARLHHVHCDGEKLPQVALVARTNSLFPLLHKHPMSFILLVKRSFIIQGNFILQLRRGSLLNVAKS